jgi:hypothetical protein
MRTTFSGSPLREILAGSTEFRMLQISARFTEASSNLDRSAASSGKITMAAQKTRIRGGEIRVTWTLVFIRA